MYRMLVQYNSDYIGREEKKQDLEAALSFLKGIIKIDDVEQPEKKKNNRKKWNDLYDGLDFLNG